jgi:hypothetical protein
LYCTPDIFKIIKLRVVREADNVERMGHTRMKVYVEKTARKRQLGKTSVRRRITIKQG